MLAHLLKLIRVLEIQLKIVAVRKTVQIEHINKYKNSLRTKNNYNNSSDNVSKAEAVRDHEQIKQPCKA